MVLRVLGLALCFLLGVYVSQPVAQVTVRLAGSTLGEQQTQTTHLNAIETATESSATSLDAIEAALSADAIHDNAFLTTGPQMMFAAVDATTTAFPNVVAAGDAVRATGSLYGIQYVQRVNEDGTLQEQVDPCTAQTKLYAAVNGATDLQIFAGVAARTAYICSFNLVTATAQNIAIMSGTGTICGTGTRELPGLSGGTTAAAGWNLAANGGLAFGNGSATIAQAQSAADAVCVDTSGTGQFSGGLTYVRQP